MTAGTTVRAPDGTEVVLGEIGTRVLLENSRVRVWEVALDAGEAQPWHLHHNPYVVLCLATSPCRMDWLDGGRARELDETVGGAVYRPVSLVHMLTNVGDSPYRNRLIEFLDLGDEASGEPAPVPGAPVPGAPVPGAPVPGATRPGDGIPGGGGLESGFDRTASSAAVPAETVPVTTVVDEADVRVQHVTPEAGESPTWRAGACPALVIDLDLSTPTVTYLEPGESHPFPAEPARTSGYNLVELRYCAT